LGAERQSDLIMPYIINKTILRKKKNHLRVLVDVAIVVVAIPVVIIASISLLLYFLFLRLKSLFFREKEGTNNVDTYQYRTVLLENDLVRIVLNEDEMDAELTNLNQLWAEEVYNKETYLYRAETSPVIPELHGSICCFYLNEHPDGALLQLMPEPKRADGKLNTRLVFLRFSDLQVFNIDEVGAYFLYNDQKNSRLIRGFNEKESISMEIGW
jgi:hypothetical protein